MTTDWLTRTSPWVAVVTISCAWVVIGLLTGSAARFLSDGFLARDTWLSRSRHFERRGRIYQSTLGVMRWKDRLPEAGALLGGSRSKRHLGGGDTAALLTFQAETRRAEYVHWMNIAAGPGFVLVLPAWAAASVAGFAVMVHMPFVVVQRYNRLRIDRVLERRTRRLCRGST